MTYNPFSLAGKSILVTGASSGIGRSVAVECSKMGAKMLITGRDSCRLDETFAALEGSGHNQFVADLSVQEGVETILNSVPPLDGFVPAAGFTKLLPIQYINRDDLDHILSVNTIAPIMLTQRFVKNKQLNRGSSIVFISSIAGIYSVSPGNGMYSATKGAIDAYMKSAALELAEKGIRCNSVNPGTVHSNILKDGVITADQLRERAKQYPLKRFGKPEEIAYAVIYLLSDASAWVTGTSLLIDGGFTLQ